MTPPRQLHAVRAEMPRGQERVSVYDRPPGDPRCALLLRGAMPRALAELLVLVLRVGAMARRVSFTEEHRRRPARALPGGDG